MYTEVVLKKCRKSEEMVTVHSLLLCTVTENVRTKL